MDIDFITDLSDGTFRITLGTNPNSVSGNIALLNRFELTFLTKRRQFIFGDKYIADTFGGDAAKFVSRPQVLNDVKSISASISTAIDLTVQSMLDDQSSSIPDTEKLSSAELISLDIIDDMITAIIQVEPVEAETYEALQFRLPITKG